MKFNKILILLAATLFLIISCYDNPPYPGIEETSWFGTNEGCGRYVEVTFHTDGTCDATFYVRSGDSDNPSHTEVAKGTGASYKPFDGYTTSSTLAMTYVAEIPAPTEGPLVDFPDKIGISMFYDNHRFFINVAGHYSYPVDMNR